MGEYAIKLPDVGEGVAEAELVEWRVKAGDVVREDDVIAAVMTDKATVEIPSPVEGKVAWLGAEVGDVVAVGAPLVRLEVEGEGNIAAQEVPQAAPQPAERRKEARQPQPPGDDADEQRAPGPGGEPVDEPPPRRFGGAAPRREGEKPLASPAVRLRAREAGVDLRRVPWSGPAGRITHEDLDAFLRHGDRAAGPSARAPNLSIDEAKVVGLRRRIAERMAAANARIPHITYVEEVDVTALEELRAKLNAEKREDRPRLTLLPFLMLAIARTVAEQPHLNAHFDDEAGVVRRYGGVHIGMATQTAGGLMVPVIRHVEALDLWGCAAEANRLAEAARSGAATREELQGSTISITSLGALGGVVTTPIINHPEVAIVGVNKILVRPVWDGAGFTPRKMMNLSSSFDHRVVDGWDAAVFVQRVKGFLESPATIFLES